MQSCLMGKFVLYLVLSQCLFGHVVFSLDLHLHLLGHIRNHQIDDSANKEDHVLPRGDKRAVLGSAPAPRHSSTKNKTRQFSHIS